MLEFEARIVRRKNTIFKLFTRNVFVKKCEIKPKTIFASVLYLNLLSTLGLIYLKTGLLRMSRLCASVTLRKGRVNVRILRQTNLFTSLYDL